MWKSVVEEDLRGNKIRISPQSVSQSQTSEEPTSHQGTIIEEII